VNKLYTINGFTVGELVTYTARYQAHSGGEDPDRELLCVITRKYKNSQYLQIMSVETGIKYSTTAGWLRKIEDESRNFV